MLNAIARENEEDKKRRKLEEAQGNGKPNSLDNTAVSSTTGLSLERHFATSQEESYWKRLFDRDDRVEMVVSRIAYYIPAQ